MTNEQIIATGQQIYDETEVGANTSERIGGVIKGIGQRLATRDTEVEEALSQLANQNAGIDAKNGYYTNSQAASESALTVTAPGYVLSAGGNIRIKMAHSKSVSSVTLNINNTGAKALYYNGEPVDSENTWEDGETIVVYYDGESYYATNSLGGKKGDDDLSQFFNVVEEQVGGSANLLNPADWEVGLLKTDGTINSGATTYTTTGYIEVESGQTYTFFGLISSNDITPAPVAEVAYVCGYSDIDIVTGERAAYSPYVSVITIPSGVRYVRLSIKKNYSNYGGADRTTHTGLIQGSNLTSADWEEYSETSIVKHISLNDNGKSVEQKEDNELITKKNLLEYIADEIGKLDIPDVSGITTAVAAIEAKTDLLDVESQQIGGSNNILDPAIIEAGFLSKNNTITPNGAYCHTGLIEVEEDTTYTFFGRASYNDTSSVPRAEVKVVCYFGENEELISGEQFDTNQSQISVGAGVKYIKLCINKDYTNWGDADRTTYTGLFKGDDLTGGDWEEYSESTTIQSLVYNINTPIADKQAKEIVVKKDLPVQEEEEGGEEYPITMTYTKGTGNNIDTFRVSDNDGNFIECTFDKLNKNDYYGGNHIFNFLNYRYKDITVPATDDVAPMHVKSSANTIGGNHAVQCQVVTANNHGLSNSDVGKNITSPNNESFVIARVVDNNTFWVLPLDRTCYGSFTFGTGTATYDGNSIVVISSENTNLMPTNKILSQKVFVDGEETSFTETKTIQAKESIDFIDVYNIVDADYAKNYLTVDDGKVVYDSPMHIVVENIYRFEKDLKVVVTANVIFMQKTFVEDILFSDAAIKTPLSYDKSTSKFYVPGSKSFSLGNTSYNYAEPANFVRPAGNNVHYEFNVETFADANKPVTRIIQISKDDVGFAIGYLPIGVGADLMKYTSTPMVLYNTAKTYPHGVDRAGLIANNKDDNGDTPANSVYNAVLYRIPFDAANQGEGRICLYDVDYNGFKYVFVDYSQTIFDYIELDDSLNGHSIELVEQRNAVLTSPVYNGGFYVNATHVSGDSSYCVVKIKL